MNSPSVGPSHGMQPFRNRLLQLESPMGSQALPANLLQRGLLSPRVCRSCQEPAPAWAAHKVTASFGHPPAPAWGPPLAAGGYLLHRGPPWTAGGQPASPWSSSRAAGECLLQCLERLPPSFFTDLGVCRVISLKYFHSSVSTDVPQHVFPLLKYVIPEALPSLIGSALASSWSVLELAGTGSVRHGENFWHLLREAIPVAPLLPKPCHRSPQQRGRIGILQLHKEHRCVVVWHLSTESSNHVFLSSSR